MLLSCAFRQTQLFILMNFLFDTAGIDQQSDKWNGIQVSRWHLHSLKINWYQDCMSSIIDPTFTIPQTRHRKADILLVVNGTFRGPRGANNFQDLRVFQVLTPESWMSYSVKIWGASIWRQGAIVENIIPQRKKTQTIPPQKKLPTGKKTQQMIPQKKHTCLGKSQET